MLKIDIHPQLKQGDSLVQPSMPEGDDSENRLTSHHLSYPDGRRYAATAYPTKRIIGDKQPRSRAHLHPPPKGRGFTCFSGKILLSQLLKNTLDLDFCITLNRKITRAELLEDALTLSEQLPQNKQYAINLCQDRYLFIVAYLAVFLRQQISILPQNTAEKTLINLQEQYTDSYILSDKNNAADFYIYPELLNKKSQQPFPLVDIDSSVSISFTSGSTGEPKAISKTWREFQVSAQLALEQFNLQNERCTLVSTAPMQHMFGLETSFFWVLFSKLCLHNSRPFYPEDIRATLNSIQNDKILISTPRHLNTCCQNNTPWPPIKFILSSTAPMKKELALKLEATFKSPVFEIFGSTETLSFASRQITQSEQWTPYQEIKLSLNQEQLIIQGGHLPNPLTLDDLFSLNQTGQFTLLGRSSEIIKIAGKRASLSELNTHLNQI